MFLLLSIWCTLLTSTSATLIDLCWPNAKEWSNFNLTLDRKLISTTPIGSVCHLNSYNEKECTKLRSVWNNAETHIASPLSIIAPYFANYSCDPFSAKESHCDIGTYVQYTVKATSFSDYQKTLTFAKQRNIRLTIRNTGHDYYGKSTGAGAIALWTHHLKEIKILDYNPTIYQGKAIKAGAGVSVIEASIAAHLQGLVVVGANDKTVGFAGGYSQGGGHGQLVSRFGLAADQVLEWEVITVDGKFLTASPSENSDLYWALSGGGGGTYGAVVSMTSRAHPDEQTSAANLTFTNLGVSQDSFYDVVRTFIGSLPSLVDAGAVSVWLVTNSTFSMTPASGFGLTKEELNLIMSPTIEKLKQHNMTYSYFIDSFPTYLDCFNKMTPTTPVSDIQIGGRFIPRSLLSTKATTESLISALRTIADTVPAISGIAMDASKKPGHVPNSANPEWRNLIFNCVVGTWWSNENVEANLASQKLVTEDALPLLEKLTPKGGAYLSEGDFLQKDWMSVFYGVNYQKLKRIKRKYDPDNLFYTITSVGSDAWIEQKDGRLCRF